VNFPNIWRVRIHDVSGVNGTIGYVVTGKISMDGVRVGLGNTVDEWE